MYIFCKFLSTMNIVDPIFLLHVVSTIFASDPPDIFTCQGARGFKVSGLKQVLLALHPFLDDINHKNRWLANSKRVMGLRSPQLD